MDQDQYTRIMAELATIRKLLDYTLVIVTISIMIKLVLIMLVCRIRSSLNEVHSTIDIIKEYNRQNKDRTRQQIRAIADVSSDLSQCSRELTQVVKDKADSAQESDMIPTTRAGV